MIHIGDCRDILPTLPAESVQCVVTSPPYFGLRDYGRDGQIGLEPSPSEFVEAMVQVFREVRRVLRADGTLWLNLGDSYAGTGGLSVQSGKEFEGRARGRQKLCRSARAKPDGWIKTKELVGIPWMVAFALRADGWYLRQDIIWAKPNPMPESVRDRCTKSHEYLFLLSKSERYYFDADAIAEPLAASSIDRLSQPTLDQQAGSDRVPGKTNGAMKAVRAKGNRKTFRGGGVYTGGRSFDNDADIQNDSIGNAPNLRDVRNRRSVWTVATMPFKEAHFATFPEALIEPCILAGTKPGDVVLDPFMGAGTTAVVATRYGRNYVGCELNSEYAAIAERRLAGTTMGLAL